MTTLSDSSLPLIHSFIHSFIPLSLLIDGRACQRSHQTKAYLKRHYQPGAHNTQAVFLKGLATVSAAQAKGYFRHSNFPGCDSGEDEAAVVAVAAIAMLLRKR
jgi:hypothetical protein